METERITLSQRERGRWKVLHEVQQMHRSQVGTGSHVRNALQTHDSSSWLSWEFRGTVIGGSERS
jgi:hypothetical protein